MRVPRMMHHATRAAILASALLLATLLGPLAAGATPWQGDLLPDSIVSWWSRPNAAYQSRHGITYLTGVSSAGDWVWGAYDHKSGITTRRTLGRIRPDDHNTPAIIAPADRPPAVFYTGHNKSSVIWYRVSRKIGDWLPGPERAMPMPGVVTYVQVHRGRTPDTLLLLTRCGTRWLLAVSEDYGESWTLRPLLQFDSGSYAYVVSSQLADGTIRLCAYGHPAKSTLSAVYYAEIDPSGDVHGAGPGVSANIYSGAGLPLEAPGSLEHIYEYADGARARLFELSKSDEPEVILAEWVGEAEAEYVYLHRTSGVWESERIVPTGRPIGYDYSTRYLGGASFVDTAAGRDVYISREASGTWFLERWRREGGVWVPSLIRSSKHILARPSVPANASSQLPLVWLDLTRYDGYTKFRGSTHAILPEGRPRTFESGTAVCGDWDGDGVTDPGVFRAGAWSLDVGDSTVRVRLGRKGDLPIVGDWDGDGIDGIGVRRGAEWILSDSATATAVSRRFTWGRRSDRALAGDWDGDGIDSIGLRRGASWLLKDATGPGPADRAFEFGLVSDAPVVGDWDGDGVDGFGLRRGREWILRDRSDETTSDVRFTFGVPADASVPGRWGARPTDAPGVRRAATGVWYVVDSASGLPTFDLAANRFRF